MPQFNAGFGQFQAQLDSGSLNNTQDVTPNAFVETRFFYTDMHVKIFLTRHTRLQPYVSPGCGFLFFDPKDLQGISLVENIFARPEEETYPGVIFTCPLTAGFQYRLNDLASFSLDGTWRVINSDYIDNVGKLGNQSGNDRLFAAQGAMYISINALKLRHIRQEIPAEPLPMTLEDADEAVSAALRSSSFLYYPLQRGDNLDTLAAWLGISRLILNNLNHLGQGALPAGKVLVIPNIIFMLAEPPHFNDTAIRNAVRKRAFVYYTVHKGDKLAFISLKSGIPVAIIRQLNFIENEEPEAGMLLRLPYLKP